MPKSDKNPSASKIPVVLLLVGALGCLALALFFGLRHSSGGSDPLQVTESSFEKEVLRSDLPVLVDFWAVWCGPCRMMAPTVEKMEQEFKGRLKVVKVDVDQNPGLSRTYQINGIPALLIFHKGTLVKTWVGAMPEDNFRTELQKVYTSLL